MTTLKNAAMYACRDLSCRILAGDAQAWQQVDRIEKRWRIQGLTLALVERQKQKTKEFLQAESKRHDRINPDRLTYLHR
jgi:hypothetical protein